MTIQSKSMDGRLLTFLRKHPIGHLGTVGKDGTPMVATVFYTADESLYIYFVTKSDTAKYKNMQHNNQVALTVTDEKLLKTVQIRGKVHLLPNDTVELTDAISALEDLHFEQTAKWKSPISKINRGEYRFVKIVPTWIRSTNFKNWDNLIDYMQVDL